MVVSIPLKRAMIMTTSARTCICILICLLVIVLSCFASHPIADNMVIHANNNAIVNTVDSSVVQTSNMLVDIIRSSLTPTPYHNTMIYLWRGVDVLAPAIATSMAIINSFSPQKYSHMTMLYERPVTYIFTGAMNYANLVMFMKLVNFMIPSPPRDVAAYPSDHHLVKIICSLVYGYVMYHNLKKAIAMLRGGPVHQHDILK